MNRPLLLDTCAALWITEETGTLTDAAARLLDAEDEVGTPIYISPVTGWEVGLLVSRGRLALSQEPKAWFKSLLDDDFPLAPLDAEIMIDSSFLPHCDLRDPADRLIAATARRLGARIFTRDRLILNYAEAGHLWAEPC